MNKIACCFVFVSTFTLLGCSGEIGSGAPEATQTTSASARDMAACVFERLDKSGECRDGLRVSHYERSGEARIICSITATFITSAVRDIYSIEFTPVDSKSSTVRFWGHTTAPGIPTYSSRIMPVVNACAATEAGSSRKSL